MLRKLLRRVRSKIAGWFFPAPVRSVLIAEGTLQNICAMAQSSHPKEMLSFLSSSQGPKDGVLLIDELQLQSYIASVDSAYVMLSQLPMTTTIVGTVHSHPGGNPSPSDADRQLFAKFGYVHAIIGEPYRGEHIRFYGAYGQRIAVTVVADSLQG